MLPGLKNEQKVDLKDDKWTRKEKIVLLIALVSALAILVYSSIFVFTMIPTSKIMPSNELWNSTITFFTE